MSMSLLENAIKLATKAHKGQFRRDGVTPYINHPLAVMEMMDTDEEKIVAVLHDVIEDTDYKLHRSNNRKYFQILSPKGELTDIPEYIYSNLMMITHIIGISYTEYIDGIALSKISTKVKIADMFHNISDNPTDKQKEKYFKALAVLLKGV